MLVAGLASAQTAYNIEPVSPCVTVSNQAVSNAVACWITFNDLGQIVLGVKNLGTVNINNPNNTLTGTVSRTPQGPPIQIDIYLQGVRIQSVYVDSLAGNELKRITVSIPSTYGKPRCGESRLLKMIVDPYHRIDESNENDNSVEMTKDRPCPDMAIESISKNWNSLRTEFVAEIKLVNRGNAPAKFRYLAMADPSQAVFGPLPAADFDKPIEIPVGGWKTFTIGSALATQHLYVRVFLDRFGEVEELDESNNFKDEVLNN